MSITKNSNNSSPKNDILAIVKLKLQQTQNTLEETTEERDSLKEANKKLESENTILMQDTMRLKLNLSEKNSQMSNRYTVAALETKIESYEKEIKQLQKALDKSDRYIADLEQIKSNNKNQFLNDSKSTKNVKFSDKIDTIHLNNDENNLSSIHIASNNHNSFETSSVHAFNGSNTKQGIISKDNFYGSPSKIQPSPSKPLAPTLLLSNKISSFNDRLKKMNNQSAELEIPSPLPKSISNDNQLLLLNDNKPVLMNNSNGNWFSPMKRLRLDEIVKDDYCFEKPSFNGEDTLNSTNYTINNNESTNMNMKSPTKSLFDYNKTMNSSNNHLKSEQTQSSIVNSNNDDKSYELLLNNSTSEFKDCLKLLSQAEKKVQNRISPKHDNNQIKSKNSSFTSLSYTSSNNLINSDDTTSSFTLTNTILPASNNCASNSSATLSSSSFLSSNNLNTAIFDIKNDKGSNTNESIFKNNIFSCQRMNNLPNKIKKYSSMDLSLGNNHLKRI